MKIRGFIFFAILMVIVSCKKEPQHFEKEPETPPLLRDGLIGTYYLDCSKTEWNTGQYSYHRVSYFEDTVVIEPVLEDTGGVKIGTEIFYLHWVTTTTLPHRYSYSSTEWEHYAGPHWPRITFTTTDTITYQYGSGGLGGGIDYKCIGIKQ